MSVVYLESSAVLAWLFGEKSASTVIRVINSAEQVLSSSLTLIESRRAIVRAVAQRLLSTADGRRLEGLLQHEALGWLLMKIDDGIAERAGRALPHEPVRTLDALHLATVLEFVAAFPTVAVLSFDERIRENCRALGLPVVGE